jgi:hypothetical protein
MNQVANEKARQAKSVTWCDELSDADSRDACRYGVVITDATEKKDTKLCDTLSPVYKKECSSTIARMVATESGDVKKCDALAPTSLSGASEIETIRVDQCRMEIVTRGTSTDPKACDVIADTGVRTMCVSLLKITKDQKSLPTP